MNRTPDVERVLREYFADDGLAAPDFILDDVAVRISRQPRRFVRFPGRTNVTTPVKLIAGLAAALVVAVVGYSLLPQTSGPGGPATAPPASAQPTATPPASAQPTATAVAAGALPEGTLAAGRYRIDLSGIDPGFAVLADIPAGWSGAPGGTAVTSPEGNDGGILLSFMLADGLFSDPCRWDLDGTGSLTQPGDVEVGPTVDDLVAALRANASYTTSGVEPVMVSGFQGTALDLQFPGDDVMSTCDQLGPESPFDGPAYVVFSHAGGTFYVQGPNSRWHLHIVDVDGTRLITMISIEQGSPQAAIAAAEAIVDSFEITP